MKLIYFLAYTIGNIFFTVFLRNFFCTILSKCKVSRHTEFFCYAVFFAALSASSILITNPSISLLGSSFALALLSLLYEGSYTKKLLSVLSLSIYSNFIHYGLIYLSGQGNLLLFNSARINSVVGIALECLCLYVFYFSLTLARHVFKENIFVVINSTAASLVSLCLLLLLCISLLHSHENYEGFYVLIIFLLAIIDLLVLFFHGFKLIKIKLALISYQNKYYQEQLDIIRSSEARVSGLRHDLQNHLMIISDLINQKDFVNAKVYLSSLNAELNPGNTISSTGNFIVDSLLNCKLQNLDARHIHLDYVAEIPTELKIDSFDLTVILGNLIDNALESFQQQPNAERKDLHILLKYECGKLSIKISNSFDGHLHMFKNRILTRKTDAAIHGIGLSNVSAAINKYHGQLKIIPSKNTFTVCAILFEPQEEAE